MVLPYFVLSLDTSPSWPADALRRAHFFRLDGEARPFVRHTPYMLARNTLCRRSRCAPCFLLLPRCSWHMAKAKYRVPNGTQSLPFLAHAPPAFCSFPFTPAPTSDLNHTWKSRGNIKYEYMVTLSTVRSTLYFSLVPSWWGYSFVDSSRRLIFPY